jgi:hypothetical protein
MQRSQPLRQFLPRIGTAYLGGHRAEAHADPQRGQTVRVAFDLPKEPGPSGPGTRQGRVAAASVGLLRYTSHGVRLVALIGALFLAQAWVAGNPAAREQRPSRHNSVQTVPAGRVQSGSPDSVDRLVRNWNLRWHKRHVAFPKFARGDDPNDNETSDDPNDDDDAWDDLNGDDDTDVPIITWLWDTVPYLSPAERAPVIATAPSSPPCQTRQRLRC